MERKRGRIALGIVGGLGLLVVALAALVWGTTYHPAEEEAARLTCPDQAPLLANGQPLKVLNWNVQYFAGKDYVFFYDVPTNDGPDERPSPEAIATTLDAAARLIQAEQPDLILLQEVDEGAARTDYRDQTADLLARLPANAYPCVAETFYWRAAYVPHARIHGAVGMKLVILSRYRIDEATRYQLAEMPADPLTRQFNLKRAILSARLPLTQGGALVAMTTHLDAFAQGSDTMTQQVAEVESILAGLEDVGTPWLIGGDFNLLPTEAAYAALPPSHQGYYNPAREIEPLIDAYPVVPSLEAVSGPDAPSWFTHYPNDPLIAGPDRTIDYLFYSDRLTLGDHYVRAADALRLSDHLPLIVEWRIP